MRPYGQKKIPHGRHPHNECSICSSDAPEKGQARQRLKAETEEEIAQIIEECRKGDMDQILEVTK